MLRLRWHILRNRFVAEVSFKDIWDWEVQKQNVKVLLIYIYFKIQLK